MKIDLKGLSQLYYARPAPMLRESRVKNWSILPENKNLLHINII